MKFLVALLTREVSPFSLNGEQEKVVFSDFALVQVVIRMQRPRDSTRFDLPLQKNRTSAHKQQKRLIMVQGFLSHVPRFAFVCIPMSVSVVGKHASPWLSRNHLHRQPTSSGGRRKSRGSRSRRRLLWHEQQRRTVHVERLQRQLRAPEPVCLHALPAPPPCGRQAEPRPP